MDNNWTIDQENLKKKLLLETVNSMAIDNNWTIATDQESQKRKREIQLLLNIVEPYPEYQPFVLTDEACFFDAVIKDEEIIVKRLEFYFGTHLTIPLTLPLWQFVDRIKERWPEWPDDLKLGEKQ